jgi:hypothetical protein
LMARVIIPLVPATARTQSLVQELSKEALDSRFRGNERSLMLCLRAGL